MAADSYREVERLVREHAPYMRALAARLAPDPSEADDIAQEAFLLAFQKRDALDHSYDLRPWLAQTVRNLSRRAWERAMKENRLKRDALAHYVAQMAVDATGLYEAPARDARARCLDKLPEKSRSLLNLRYNLGHRSERIAEEIRATASAERMSLVRVRQQLKVCIEGEMQEASA